jgi:dTDP-glucose 4,6-dehydratase
MNIEDKILQEDIEILAAKHDWSELYHSSALVTGATGLIGQQLVFLLLHLNETQNADIHVYALVRNAEKAQIIFRDCRCGFDRQLPDKLHFVVGDIRRPLAVGEKIDYIIHGASITQSRAFVDFPVETIETAYTGTRNMLEFAREKQVKSIAYLSSMEVFGVTDPQLSEVKESDYGYIDILNPRSSYSESKRMCECLCAGYAKQHNLPVKIARLTQTLGCGVSYSDTRIAAMFSRCVIENQDIVLKTEGKVRRPCLYTRDAVSAIFTVLLKGKKGEAYVAANKTTAKSVREIAEMIVEKIAENRIALKFNITNPAEYAFNQNLDLSLNTDKLESIGWRAEVGLEEAYRRMIDSMKQSK